MQKNAIYYSRYENIHLSCKVSGHLWREGDNRVREGFTEDW